MWEGLTCNAMVEMVELVRRKRMQGAQKTDRAPMETGPGILALEIPTVPEEEEDGEGKKRYKCEPPRSKKLWDDPNGWAAGVARARKYRYIRCFAANVKESGEGKREGASAHKTSKRGFVLSPPGQSYSSIAVTFEG
jgi:hypothetical protein